MDKLTKAQRRKNMQANKSTGTKPEIMLAKKLYERGHRYRKNNKKVFGKPDLTFKKIKLAIFVDGEFWHGKDWHKTKFDHLTNKEYWTNKIERNIERDKEVNQELVSQGWKILRYWSQDILNNLSSCVLEIEREIRTLSMDLEEKISLETVEDKQFRIKLIEPENNQESLLTHFKHNTKIDDPYINKSKPETLKKEIKPYEDLEEEILNKAAESDISTEEVTKNKGSNVKK